MNRHKDYLFQKRLALRLPIDSFRFDFRYVDAPPFILVVALRTHSISRRGNHESNGPFHFGGFKWDVEDLFAVATHLTSTYGYVIDLLVGHSRGVVDAFRWICTAEEGKNVRGFVNVSGRYRMPVSSLRYGPGLLCFLIDPSLRKYEV